MILGHLYCFPDLELLLGIDAVRQWKMSPKQGKGVNTLHGDIVIPAASVTVVSAVMRPRLL